MIHFLCAFCCWEQLGDKLQAGLEVHTYTKNPMFMQSLVAIWTFFRFLLKICWIYGEFLPEIKEWTPDPVVLVAGLFNVHLSSIYCTVFHCDHTQIK